MDVNYLLLVFWLDKLIVKVFHANLVYLDHNYNLYKYLMREINVDFNQKKDQKYDKDFIRNQSDFLDKMMSHSQNNYSDVCKVDSSKGPFKSKLVNE